MQYLVYLIFYDDSNDKKSNNTMLATTVLREITHCGHTHTERVMHMRFVHVCGICARSFY